jgi:quinol monooxygenase YgiN
MDPTTMSEQSITPQPAKLAIVGTIEVAPEKKAQFLTSLMAHRTRCLKDEPGTLSFEIMTPHDEDTKLFLCEVYRDAAAFDVHRNGASNAQFRQETTGMGAKLSFTRCAVIE